MQAYTVKTWPCRSDTIFRKGNTAQFDESES